MYLIGSVQSHAGSLDKIKYAPSCSHWRIQTRLNCVKSWTDALTAVKYVTRAKDSCMGRKLNCQKCLSIIWIRPLICFLSNTSLQTWGKKQTESYTSRFFFLDFSWIPWSNFNFFVAFGFSIRRSSPTRHLLKYFLRRNLQGCYPKLCSHISPALCSSLPSRNNNWFRGPGPCSEFN